MAALSTELSNDVPGTDVWEITQTGARTFAASGATILDTLAALISATQDEPRIDSPGLLSNGRGAGGLFIAINFDREEFEGVMTVEV